LLRGVPCSFPSLDGRGWGRVMQCFVYPLLAEEGLGGGYFRVIKTAKSKWAVFLKFL